MATGDYAAGVEPAGYDPVPDYSPPRSVTVRAALHFDGATRSYVHLDSGLLEELHPVDQMMAWGLLFPKGTFASAPDIGHTFEEIEFADSPSLQNDVENRINISQPIARLLSEGKVEIFRVDTYAFKGTLVVVVNYYNLVTDPKRNTARAIGEPPQS